ncbi:MAG: MFS transporter [Fimbriimonadaceae bacterium]|nr:MFS transporter [Fimbriimonadaceae bacterium]
MRALRHRDFALLWFGAFFSFCGSWVQNVAQGWLVYDLTGDKAKLALVSFMGMVPVSFIGPIAGVVVDMVNRRILLIGTQLVFASCALFLAFATWQGFVRYEHILGAALLIGISSSLEMPARQSLVSSVVPKEDLAAAVPVNAMAFNVARVLGPALGGQMLAWFGPKMCYLVNGLSYIGLISAVLAIRANLGASQKRTWRIKALLADGIRYTLSHPKLRPLFVLEAMTSTFGLAYLAQMPAIARDLLGLGEQGLGWCMTAIGVGAITGLVTVYKLTDRHVKGRLVRLALVNIAICLLLLSVVRVPWVAYVIFAVLGGSTVMQFNTTNTIFQLVAPENLRGRVISMHVWAISGLGPFGALALGFVASYAGLPTALAIGGGCVLVGAVATLVKRWDFETRDSEEA